MNKYLVIVFSIFLILLANIDISQAAASIELIPTNPDHPNKCWIPSLKKAYNVGEKWYEPGACMENQCGQLNDKLAISRYSCGVVAVHDKNCRLESDETKQYPKCCPQVKCN